MRFTAALSILSLFVGCGDGRPSRVPVSGQVLLDGKPLNYGSIQFLPPNARASYGNLDSEGRFTLTCYDPNDGVVPGQLTVLIISGEPIGETGIRWHAPKKYSNYRTSDLKQEITGPTSNLTINISWDGGHPYVEEG